MRKNQQDEPVEFETIEKTARPGPAVWATGILVVVATIVAFYFALNFAENDRQRSLQAWQNQLNIVADSRLGAVNDWFSLQTQAISKVAQNQSVSFYLTELSWSGDASSVTDGDARLAIIENFLKWSASQSGFDAPPSGADVAANIERQPRAGIALVAPNGTIMAATRWMPAVKTPLEQYIAANTGEKPYLSDVYTNDASEPTIAFVAPVFGEQTASDNNIVGYVIGIRPLDSGLFDRLKQPGNTAQSAETYLVRRHDNQIEFLSPLADGSAPLTRQFATDTPRLAAAFAMTTPGGFTVARDYRNERVLVTGRQLVSPPWTLVRTVSADEALGDINRRRNAILTILGLTILTVAICLLLVWRHGASVRVAHEADRYAHMASRFEKLSHFLRIVTDSQPTSISAVDGTGKISFANTAAARHAGIAAEDMPGKKLSQLLPPSRAKILAEKNQQVMTEHKPVTAIHSFLEDELTRIVKADHLPLSEQPDGSHTPGVLMVLEDITDLVTERERRENNLRQLVTTLATIIDSRDPFSANHSRRVAEVAEAIGQEMNLPDVEVETAEIAGALMNLGKIMVPRDVLTRPDQITPDELEDIRHHVMMSADLLKNVEFDGPVVATIRQAHAHWDGSGHPSGLAGEKILISARIVAVANAFTAMISARAHRPGMDFDTAVRVLAEGAGKTYDRKPVAALANYLDNRGGRTHWAHFGQQPEAT